jgi:hypothetical protein
MSLLGFTGDAWRRPYDKDEIRSSIKMPALPGAIGNLKLP